MELNYQNYIMYKKKHTHTHHNHISIEETNIREWNECIWIQRNFSYVPDILTEKIIFIKHFFLFSYVWCKIKTKKAHFSRIINT